MGFTVSSDQSQDFTQIPNAFITTYMPLANGNYVKLYLYLQMLCQHTGENPVITVDRLADKMECTENDIFRALRYWKKQGLLVWSESGGEIEDIRLLTAPAGRTVPTEWAAAQETGAAAQAMLKETGVTAQEAPEETMAVAPPDPEPVAAIPSGATEPYTAPQKHSYTPLQAEALRKDIEIDRAVRNVEQLLGEPVSPSHLQVILYFMCDVGFSAELLITLYETALHKGKKKPNYIEAIGVSWAGKGIRTPEEAKTEASAFSGRYALVTRTLGITDTLAPLQREIIDQWNRYSFDDAVIEEACQRAVRQIGGGQKGLKYAAGILEKWSEQQVHSLADIQKADEAFEHRKKNAAQVKPASAAGSKNKFQKFPQRVYTAADYSSLEKRLLQKTPAK